jgi:MHS family proline/betaine transporter-like MFS transporter
MSIGQSTAMGAGLSASASTSSFTVSRRRAVLAAGVGNVLEWYDFTVYAYLAVILGKLFFQSGNETAAVLATFAVFGVGFVARPFGGLLIGLFGDAKGRKPALLLTIGLMATGTCLIGLLPSYATVDRRATVSVELGKKCLLMMVARNA